MVSYALGGGLGPFLVRSVAGTGAVGISAMAASFAVGVLLARGLGVATYGYYSLALAIITIASIPSELGLPKLVTREVAAADARGDRAGMFGVLRWANRICLRLSALIALAIAVGAMVAWATGSTVMGAAVLLGVPVIPLVSLARLRGGGLQGLHHIARGQVSTNLLRPLLLSLLLFAAWGIGWNVGAPGAMALYSVTALAAFFVSDSWLNRRLPERPDGPPPLPSAAQSRRWLGSAIPLALTTGMQALQAELSILLVGIIAAPTTVGLFRIANVTAVIAAAAIPIAVQVALPVFAKLHAQEDKPRLQKAVAALALAQFCGVLALALPLLLAAEPLIRLVFGEAYVPASNALRILAAGQVVNAAFGPNVALLNMTHHERRVTRAMVVGGALTLVLVPLFTNLWGLNGAAAALLVSLLSWNILTWWDARRLLEIETSIVSLRILFSR